MNARLTAKDRGLIKGALRRAFAKSQLHQEVIAESIIQHSDPSRPRVKTWCRCNVCKQPEAKSYMQVDHILPLVAVDSSFQEMSLEEAVNKLWCDKSNLQSICPACHDEKGAKEREERKAHKKLKRSIENGKSKRS